VLFAVEVKHLLLALDAGGGGICHEPGDPP
jgi:hypothetical protein